MYRHQQLVHNGEQPRFTMKVVGSHKSALARQISEAVRIGRRGGESRILNSKAEYNRSHIPRLRVEKEQETKKREEEQRQQEQNRERELEREYQSWEATKTRIKDRERRNIVEKNAKWGGAGSSRNTKNRRMEDDKGSQGAPRVKKRRYEMVREDWGTTPAKATPQHTIPTSSREQMEREMTIPSSTTHPNEEQNYAKTVEDLTPGQFTQQSPLPQRMEEESRTDDLMSNITDQGDTNTNEENIGDRGVGMSVSMLVGNKNEPIDGASINDMYEEMIQSGGDDAIFVTDEEPRVSSMLLGEKDELQEVVVECRYRRRGFCLIHNTKGDKMEVRTKRWGKVKHGFGWIHSKKVRYSCKTESGISQTTRSIDNVRSESQSLTSARETESLAINPLIRLEHSGIAGTRAEVKVSDNMG